MKYFKILIGFIFGLFVGYFFFAFVWWTFTFELLSVFDRAMTAVIIFIVSCAGAIVIGEVE